MEAGEEGYTLSATSTVANSDEGATFHIPLQGLALPAGEHILAISLHNTENPSSDMHIGGITLVKVEGE